MSGRLIAIRADITQLAVDVIVNAANTTLLGGGGVDGAIHQTSLALARLHNLRTIAFPAISCGVYGYPMEEACRIAVHECRAFTHESAVPVSITFALYDDAALELYRRALGGGTPESADP